MAKPLRIRYPGAIYHVMNRGLARRALFHDSRDYRRFLKSLASSVDAKRVRIYAYCLLGNHFHLLLETPHANLGAFMDHLNGLRPSVVKGSFVRRVSLSTSMGPGAAIAYGV